MQDRTEVQDLRDLGLLNEQLACLLRGEPPISHADPRWRELLDLIGAITRPDRDGVAQRLALARVGLAALLVFVDHLKASATGEHELELLRRRSGGLSLC